MHQVTRGWPNYFPHHSPYRSYGGSETAIWDLLDVRYGAATPYRVYSKYKLQAIRADNASQAIELSFFDIGSMVSFPLLPSRTENIEFIVPEPVTLAMIRLPVCFRFHFML